MTHRTLALAGLALAALLLPATAHAASVDACVLGTCVNLPIPAPLPPGPCTIVALPEVPGALPAGWVTVWFCP